MSEELSLVYDLGVALAIGLLIGIERGWEKREGTEGSRIAGVRTYGLIGVLGGVFAVLGERFGALVFGVGFAGLTVILTSAYIINLRRAGDDVSITSAVAGLLTFVFGGLAALGEAELAAASAVVTTLLLSYKPVLHRWLRRLEEQELQAGLKLLLISIVLLPILPDRGYGPWQALNPYAIWWMVVLIAALSFLGYFAVKIAGPRRGILFTGVSAGLASSTVLTLHFARLARSHAGLRPILVAGILLACTTMFPRMLLVASALAPELFQPLLVPVVIMASVTLASGLWYWRGASHGSLDTDATSPVRNPLELGSAIGFGLLLALVMLLGKVLQVRFGETGILSLAAASGIADVDAITLSLANMSHENVGVRTAAMGIVVAAATNSIAKASIAAVAGGREIALRVAVPLVVSAAAGLLSLWFRSA